jgi:hypothetical protein
MPEDSPYANRSTEIRLHKPRMINIKLIQLIKKPRVMRVFSVRRDKGVIGLIAASGLMT